MHHLYIFIRNKDLIIDQANPLSLTARGSTLDVII